MTYTCSKCSCRQVTRQGNQIVSVVEHLTDGDVQYHMRLSKLVRGGPLKIGTWVVSCNKCGHEWYRVFQGAA